ncbi:acyl-coenzyme A thioesterase PaaI-like protein [Aequitasia blattaphilus]
MNYFAPMIGTGKMYAEAKVLKSGKTISVSEVDIFDESGKKRAKGTFTCFALE